MSRGIGGLATKAVEDTDMVIYEYTGYNWNYPEYKDCNHPKDGSILIYKDCLVEAEIHEKIKRMPSGRKKKITKRIWNSVNYDELILKGKIIVENCTNCWRIDENGTDISANSILWKIFYDYQIDGKLPDNVSFFS